jgi:hypothetical protein
MDRRGGDLIDGPRDWVYAIGGIATVFIVPLGLGWLAYTTGSGPGVGVLYLLPHVLAAAYASYLYSG